MLQSANAIPAEKQSKFSNALGWTSTYLSDAFPLATNTLTSYIAVVTWANDYFETTDECDWNYQLIRWGILGLTLLYLTAAGWKAATQSTFKAFVLNFWLNYVVFLCLVALMVSLPPLGCYTTLPAIITCAGALGLLLVAAAIYV